MPCSNAGFLTQFAKRCSLRFFALVNAALRHLPGLGPGIETLPHEYLAFIVHQHDASAAPVRKVLLVNAHKILAHDHVSRRASCRTIRSEEHTSELQSLMRISYAVFCLKKKKQQQLPSDIYKHIHTHPHITQ